MCLQNSAQTFLFIYEGLSFFLLLCIEQEKKIQRYEKKNPTKFFDRELRSHYLPKEFSHQTLAINLVIKERLS